MKVLVTGATGFLGSEVVAAALAAGHDVLALRRPVASPSPVVSTDRLAWLSADLRQPGALSESLIDVEAVIHCASATSGDLSTQLAGTVLATENLLASLPEGLKRFVHVSSFSVYDFDKPSGILSEDTQLECHPLRRDAYTQTKLIQERLVRDFASDQQVPLVVARPGAIFGPGKTWDYGSGVVFKRLDFIFAPLAKMRLIHVENCADALIAALTAPTEGVLVVNLVDEEQPSHWRFHQLARRAGAPTGIGIPIPYVLVLGLGAAARIASWLFFDGRARLPELLDPPRQRVRWRPLRYARDRAERALGTRQRLSLAAGVAGMIRAQQRSSAKGGGEEL